MPQRRTILVEGFQIQWVLTLLVWVAGLILALAALIVWPLTSRRAPGELSQADLDLAVTLLVMNDRLWLPLLAFGLALTLVIVKLTHQVAGPLYRFRKVFAEVAKGDLTASARIRKRDFLHLESQALQTMLDGLAERVGQAQAAIAAIDHEVSGLPQGAGGLGVDRIAALKSHTLAAREALSHFVTERAGSPEPAAAPAAAVMPDAGFSLLELLLTSCIISTLASLAVPAYNGALERARVTRAIGDINALGKEIVMHQVRNSCFPGSLADIGRTEIRDPWGRPYEYAVASAPGGGGKGKSGGGSCLACGGACVAPGKSRKDHKLVPINADFDLYSMGRDGQSSAPLTAGPSQDDVVRGRSGSFIGLASDY